MIVFTAIHARCLYMCSYWASVSEPNVIILTCKPHTIHARVVSIGDYTVNLTHEI